LAAFDALKAWSTNPIAVNSTIACVLGNGAERDRRQVSIAATNSGVSLSCTRIVSPGLILGKKHRFES
jgi:hypothetical protein